MNILAIDDETLARKETSRQIIELLPAARVYEASNAAEARQILLNHRVDCVLLDLEMPGEHGMDLLPVIRHMSVPVIIVSGYDQYAARSYEFDVVDYLLKPVELSRLAMALARLPRPDAVEFSSKIVLFNDQKQCWPVKLSDVVMVEASGSYVVIHCKSGPAITLSRQLKDVSQLLDEHFFIRVNRSQIVNIGCLSSMRKLNNGKLIADLAGHGEISFSRRQAAAFRAKFGF